MFSRMKFVFTITLVEEFNKLFKETINCKRQSKQVTTGEPARIKNVLRNIGKGTFFSIILSDKPPHT